MSRPVGQRAVVLGGSMAGLLAARVLADHYREVVIVERDTLPAGAEHRRGVPQSRHAHALLARGQQALEELFPGLTAELVAAGAPQGDMLDSARTYFSGHRLRSAPAGVMILQASRPLLEATVRARVGAVPSVRVTEEVDVVGLEASPDGSGIIGARVHPRAGGGGEGLVEADLVVDATGRGSRTPARVGVLGFPEPAVSSVTIDLAYATRIYEHTPGLLGRDLSIIHGPTFDRPRGAAMMRIEHDRLLVTLYGIRGDHPPTDPAGFERFADGLHSADVREVLRRAAPVDEPVRFRHPASIRHHYEALRRWPRGLLVMGDAVCSFNPIYGQGMSVAALEALALRRHLMQDGALDPVRLFRAFGRVVDVPWNMASGADLAFDGVEGRRTLQMRLLSRYLAHLHARAEDDARLGRAFVRVAGLVDPPQSLLRPGTAARVLGPRRHGGWSHAGPAAPVAS